MTAHRMLEADDLMLIERVQKTPALYDTRSPNFKSAAVKEEEWKRVAKSVGQEYRQVRRRWVCLRDRYSRELKQMRLHPDKNEYGNNEFFHMMDFLRKFVKKRNRRQRGPFNVSNNWDSNTGDETKMSDGFITQIDEEVLEEPQHKEEQVIEETTDLYSNVQAHNYTEPYAEFVEVENGESFEYVQPHSQTEYKTNVLPSVNEGGYKITNERTLSSADHQQQQSVPQQQQQQKSIHHKAAASSEQKSQRQQQQQSARVEAAEPSCLKSEANETEDDYFCKSMAVYLKQLSRLHKIKAKVEMYQIIEKYIDIEEKSSAAMS